MVQTVLPLGSAAKSRKSPGLSASSEAKEGAKCGGLMGLPEVIWGKICRVSGQLLTVIHGLGTNQEKVSCLLLIAACLGPSVGGELAVVKPFDDLQFLARVPVFNQLLLVLLAHVFDDLDDSVYTSQAHL